MVNRKIIATGFLILFVIICNSTAQNVSLNYGLSVGYSKTTPNFSISTSSHYLYETTNNFNHYNVMGILEIAAPSVIRFQTGLKYFTIGYSRNIYPHPDYAYFTSPPKRDGANYSYLAIPLNINYLLPFVSGFYLSGGVESVHLVSGNYFVESANGHISELNIKGFANQFFMYTFGIGFEYKLEVFTLFIEPEYSHNFSDAANNSFRSSIIGEQISLNIGIKY